MDYIICYDLLIILFLIEMKINIEKCIDMFYL